MPVDTGPSRGHDCGPASQICKSGDALRFETGGLMHPSSELLIAKLEALFAGVETRASIASWGKSQIAALPGVSWQIGTLASVELRMPGDADSYVIRDIDLHELLGDLRREPPARPPYARVAPIRPWQARLGITYAVT